MTLLAALILLQAQAPEPFAGDDRLNRPITYSANTISVRELLEHIKRETGAPLRVSPTIAEDLVVLRVKERPAHEVLTRIAEHFDWVWTKGELGYTLAGRPGWEARERQQIEEAIYKAMSEEVEAAREALRTASGINVQATLAHIKEISKEIAALEREFENREDVDQGTWRKIRSLSGKREQLREPIDPGRLLVAQLLATMGRGELLDLARRGRVVYSVRPTAAQKQLPASALRFVDQLVAAVASATDQSRNDEDFDWDLALVHPAGAAFSPEDIATVRVALSSDLGDLLRYESWDASGSISILNRRGRVVWSEHVYSIRSIYSERDYDDIEDEERENEGEESKPDPLGPVERFPQKVADHEAVRAAIAEASSLELPPALVLESMRKGSKVDPLAYRNQIPLVIADAAECSLIADAYDLVSSYDYIAPAETLGWAIDSFCRGANSKWTYENGWVRIRNERPAVGRALTVPRPILRKYRDLVAEQLGLTMDQLAEMSLELTDLQLESPQLRTFLMFVSPFEGMDSASGGRAYALRAWASLTSEQRQALLTGGTVNVGSVSTAARAYLGEFLYRAGDDWDAGLSSELLERMFDDMTGSDGFDDEDELDDLEGPPDMDDESEEFGKVDTEITQILPFGLSPDAQLTLQGISRPAVATELEIAGRKFPVTLPAAFFGEVKLMLEGGLGSEYPMPPISFTGFRPATANGAILTLTFLPDMSAGAAMVGMTAVPGTTFGQLDELPKEIKDVIDKAYARAKKRYDRYRDIGDGGGIPPPGPAPSR